MEVLLTVLIFIVLFIYILKRILPSLILWIIKRHNRPAGEGRDNRKEGEVTVTGSSEGEKIIKKDVGDYVDFEEEKID